MSIDGLKGSGMVKRSAGKRACKQAPEDRRSCRKLMQHRERAEERKKKAKKERARERAVQNATSFGNMLSFILSVCLSLSLDLSLSFFLPLVGRLSPNCLVKLENLKRPDIVVAESEKKANIVICSNHNS